MVRLGELMMILELHRQGVSVTAIARRTGRDPKTVRKYIERGIEAPVYGPRSVGRPSKLAAYLDFLRERVTAFPDLSAARLTREIRELGYAGAYIAVKRYLAAIRPDNGPKPYEVRFETPPGVQAQVDFARFVVEFTDDPGTSRIVWLFSLVLGHSRFIFARYVMHQDLQTLLRCHIQAFGALGGVPIEILYDRMKTAVTGGFPVSGIWLRCDDADVTKHHHAKVYGKAASGSPPMSVPHLDTRIIGGHTSLLFGPYAGFSSRFLKHGSLTDLFRSITHDNILPLLDVARDNFTLTEYLIGQVLQSASHQFAALKEFFPNATRNEWKEAVAGQRVQIIKPDKDKGGYLEFGTELVAASDRSLVALLGASPGASTAAFIATEVLRTCFPDRLTNDGWLPALQRLFPTYGIDLAIDRDACRTTRADTASVLKLPDL